MANVLICDACSATVSWEGKFSVVECRYCGASVSTGLPAEPATPATADADASPEEAAVEEDSHAPVQVGEPFAVVASGSTTAELAKHGGPLRWIKRSDDFSNGIAFSPDGRLVAAGCKKKMQIWDVETGRRRRELGREYLEMRDAVGNCF
jgi:hypothetical protein